MPAPNDASAVAIAAALSDLIVRVGFPIVVAVYLLVAMEPRLDRFIDNEERLAAQMATLSNACFARSTRAPD